MGLHPMMIAWILELCGNLQQHIHHECDGASDGVDGEGSSLDGDLIGGEVDGEDDEDVVMMIVVRMVVMVLVSTFP